MLVGFREGVVLLEENGGKNVAVPGMDVHQKTEHCERFKEIA